MSYVVRMILDMVHICKSSSSRHSRHKDSEILSRSRREPNPAVAAVKQYENNNKPAFLNCEALSNQAAVDEQQPKGERLFESV